MPSHEALMKPIQQLADYMRGAAGLNQVAEIRALQADIAEKRAEIEEVQRLSDLRVHGAAPPWKLESVIDREDEPHSFEELNADLDARLDALRRGRTDWGCAGAHVGRYTTKQIEQGAPNCPQWRHHHHDAFCREPSDMELRLAGVEKPEHGWGSRA